MWLLPRLSGGIRSLRLAILYVVVAEAEWWHPLATACGSDVVVVEAERWHPLVSARGSVGERDYRRTSLPQRGVFENPEPIALLVANVLRDRTVQIVIP